MIFRGVMVALAVLLASPAGAHASYLHVDRVGTGPAASAIAGDAISRTTAYVSAPGRLQVGSAGRHAVARAVPSQCLPTAVTASAVALSCVLPDRPYTPAVMDLSTGAIAVLPSLNDLTGLITRIGAAWVSFAGFSSPDDVHVVNTRRLVNWRTQRTVSLGAGDPFGSRRRIDLDLSEPSRRLCTPLRRGRDGDIFDDIRYYPLVQQGRWALTIGNVTARVRRCGSSHRTLLKRGQGAVLGVDFVGYITRTRVVYLDLRTGKRSSRPWPTAYKPKLAAAGRRLLISAPTQQPSLSKPGAERYRLYRAG